MNSKPTVASLSAEVASLRADIAALTAALKATAPAAPQPAVPSTGSVVLWKNDAQRRFWFDKAIYALQKEMPEARSFPAPLVRARAEALFCAPRAERH